MSDEQKYQELLKEIGKIIKEKNDDIIIKTFQNDDLRKRLQKAEKELDEVRKEK